VEPDARTRWLLFKNNKRPPAREEVAALLACGVDTRVAERLAARHDPERIRTVAAVARQGTVRDRVGWVSAALERGWHLEYDRPLHRGRFLTLVWGGDGDAIRFEDCAAGRGCGPTA
jgi:hypothetical protein